MKIIYLLMFAVVPRFYLIAQGQSETFELKVIRNNPIIHVSINGHGPFTFMVDTGASGIGRIDVELAKKLSLPTGTPEENSDGHNVRQVTTSKVSEIRLGTLFFKDVELITRDYNESHKEPRIDGIIGRGFFEQKLLTMNFKEQKLVIQDGALTASQSGVIPYEKPFVVNGFVGPDEHQFYFDTGSTMTFHFPKKIAESYSLKRTGKTGHAARANTTFDITEAVLTASIRLGEVEITNQIINYSEPAKIINIGTGFLSQHILTIDQRNKLIKLE